MPSSYVANIPAIVNAIIPVSPASVYDVGIGFGKFGMLLREYLDNYEGHLQIDGCEIFEDYIANGPAMEIYDNIEIGDWLAATPVRTQYDLVLMVDVIEHFTVNSGAAALRKARQYSDNVLVSTPLGFPQDVVNGNEHERHLSEWPVVQFQECGFKVREISCDKRSVIVWVS